MDENQEEIKHIVVILTVMERPDRFYIVRMSFHVTKVHLNDLTDSDMGFTLPAWPDDASEMLPGIGDVPQELDQVPSAGAEERQ